MKKIFAELFEQFVKSNKREPKGMELIQLKFKANKLQREADKIIEFPRDKIQPLDPDDALPNYKETPGEYSRRKTPGSIEYLREEMKIAYRKEFDRLTGNETAEELTDMLKNLDTDSVPFAEGGSTSTGLNYLVGEDDTNSRVPYAAGGRRGFLKLLGGLGAAGVAFKTGLLGLGKGVAKPAAKVAAEAATGTAPPHFFKLVAKIKALGDDVTETAALAERQNVKTYKDFELTEDIATGKQEIIRYKQSDEATYYGQPLTEETYMAYTPGETIIGKGNKPVKTLDDYEEGTAFVRNDRGYTGEIVEESTTIADDIFEEVSEEIPEIIRKEKAEGGRMGYAGGKKVVEGLISLLNKKAGKDVLTTADKIAIPKKTLDRDMFKKFNDKNPDPKKEMTEDEYQDFADEIGENIEAYDFDGTVGDANRIRKDIKDYEAEMYQQYKMGKLDPEAGDKSPARKRFLEKKFEEMEDSGDPQLMTRDEIEELTFFDLGTEMDDFVLSSAEKKGKKLADSMSDAEIDLRDEFPGIEDRLIKQILTDNNPQRVAEVKQTMREALEMQNKGISVDEIIQTFKGTTRTKQASGGRIGLLAGGGVLKKLIMNLAKEKGMSGSEVLKVMNYKSLPSKIKNLMTKEEFTSMKDQRLEGVEIWRDLMASQQEMTKNIDAGKNTPAAELFEMLEKTSPGYKTVPRNISDADMLQMEQMIKNMKTKDNRQLNAKGGLANLLGE